MASDHHDGLHPSTQAHDGLRTTLNRERPSGRRGVRIAGSQAVGLTHSQSEHGQHRKRQRCGAQPHHGRTWSYSQSTGFDVFSHRTTT
eukprot:1328765-Prymnesium_polylepis.1